MSLSQTIRAASIAAVLVAGTVHFGATEQAALRAKEPAALPAPANGAAIYQAKCGGCHSFAANGIGPSHRGVFGRKAGAVAGYAYSPALRRADITWDARTLDLWLQGPQKMVKGSRMYLAVPDPAQRAAIISYLQSPRMK